MITSTSINKICSMSDQEYEVWTNERDLDLEIAEQLLKDQDATSYLKFHKCSFPENKELIMSYALELAKRKEIEKEIQEIDPFYYPLQEKCKTFCLGWNGIDETCDCGSIMLEWEMIQGCSFMDVLVEPKGEVL